MHGEEFINELDRVKTSVRRHQAAIGALIVLALVQACSIQRQSGNERQHFLPPEISRPFWLAGREASSEYFEDMGQFINGLPLNITPETVETACSAYLRYVLPRDRAKYQRRCDAEAKRIKRDSAVEWFSIESVRSDARLRRVVLEGMHQTIINDKRFRPTRRTYLIEFEHADGRFYVGTHEKVEDNDPRILKP
ncbi:TraE/TraK family type IV conjugative transfer system protein [Pseudoduganella umbonata]|nr:TraE/TraK family type IV conjugative transfer system protein [Pseudoduganella umbonata]MBB3221704.1 type IV conjugative transfer system protein TraE [Pseudoduganella umbonata]